MSNQPTDPQATDEALDDLDVPTEESDAVTGGLAWQASEGEDIIFEARED